MATKNTDIMAILKGISTKIDDETLMILTFMYHTEIDLTDPAQKRVNRSKSQYRYEGRIVKIAALEKEIADLQTKPTDSWKWPSLDNWRISYDNEPTCARAAKWYKSRINKATNWETCEKILNGWKASTNNYKDTRKYDISGYTTSTGQTIDINLETLKTLAPGTTFSKILTPKK